MADPINNDPINTGKSDLKPASWYQTEQMNKMLARDLVREALNIAHYIEGPTGEYRLSAYSKILSYISEKLDDQSISEAKKIQMVHFVVEIIREVDKYISNTGGMAGSVMRQASSVLLKASTPYVPKMPDRPAPANK